MTNGLAACAHIMTLDGQYEKPAVKPYIHWLIFLAAVLVLKCATSRREGSKAGSFRSAGTGPLNEKAL